MLIPCAGDAGENGFTGEHGVAGETGPSGDPGVQVARRVDGLTRERGPGQDGPEGILYCVHVFCNRF